MDTLKITKEALIEQLTAKREVAVGFDADQLRDHRGKCKETATARREYLRGLIKSPDNKLAEIGGYELSHEMPDSLSCPTSKVKQFDSAIQWVERDARKTFTIARDDFCGRLLLWEPEPTGNTVCT